MMLVLVAYSDDGTDIYRRGCACGGKKEAEKEGAGRIEGN